MVEITGKMSGKRSWASDAAGKTRPARTHLRRRFNATVRLVSKVLRGQKVPSSTRFEDALLALKFARVQKSVLCSASRVSFIVVKAMCGSVRYMPFRCPARKTTEQSFTFKFLALYLLFPRL